MEVSAKSGDGIQKAFYQLAAAIIEKLKESGLLASDEPADNVVELNQEQQEDPRKQPQNRQQKKKDDCCNIL